MSKDVRSLQQSPFLPSDVAVSHLHTFYTLSQKGTNVGITEFLSGNTHNVCMCTYRHILYKSFLEQRRL